MGIKDLLRFMKPHIEPIHIKKYAGKRVGIDAYSRLHKGVSPCEADAQLAYLSSLEAEKGGIVAVTSKDSDLLAYGCPTVVFKMDRYGNGEEIVQNKACALSWLRFSSICSWNWNYESLFFGFQVPELGSLCTLLE
ncbi:hypothetical protein CsSME_00027912 [Camellia sinensis var. sinensis]